MLRDRRAIFSASWSCSKSVREPGSSVSGSLTISKTLRIPKL